MKRLIIFLAIPLLIGCTINPVNELDNDGTFSINVTVENGSNFVSKIDAVYMAVIDSLNVISEIITETTYGNGTFTIELPLKMDEKYLISIDNSFNLDTKDIQISDKTAKIAGVALLAGKGKQDAGIILRMSFDPIIFFEPFSIENSEKITTLYASGVYFSGYVYVNKPVTIKGISARTEISRDIIGDIIEKTYSYYNLTLKAGWNMITDKVIQTWVDKTDIFEIELITESSHDEPSGMKWYFYEASFEDENIFQNNLKINPL